jgi:hypothetical protein
VAGSWEVRRDVLLEAIRLLDLVPSQSGIPSSDFFLVTTETGQPGYVWMSTAAGAVANVRLEGVGDWPYSKPFYLDSRLFSPFVSTFREIKNKAQFEFSRSKNELRVRCGKPFMDFSAQPSVMGYGDTPKLDSASKLQIPEGLLALIKCAAAYAASEAESPHLSCVWLMPQKGYLEVMATNQKILFRAKYRGSEWPISSPIAFPLPMLGVIQAEGLRKLVWSNPCVFAQFRKGIVWQTTSRKASMDFPEGDIQEVMARGRKLAPAFRANATRFARVVERLSAYLQYVRKEDWVLNITGTKGSEQLFLISRLPHAVITEYLRVLEPLKSSFTFDWPLDQLGSIFKFAGSVEGAVEVRLEPDAGMSFVKCGPIELAMSTKRV